MRVQASACGVLILALTCTQDGLCGVATIDYIIKNDKNTIQVSSIVDKESNEELVAKSSDAYFEFAVNGKVIDSNMPIWQLTDNDTTTLSNGATHITHTIAGMGRYSALRVVIERESFPHSPLLRERIKLSSIKKGAYRLTNVNGANHFIFPRYTLAADSPTIAVTEIRMGSQSLETLREYNPQYTYDNRPSRNLANCYMFHTDVIDHTVNPTKKAEIKGPFMVAQMGRYKVVTSYEHASQDYTYVKKSTTQQTNQSVIDASQGISGTNLYQPTDDDLWFIASVASPHGDNSCAISQKIRHGGYLNNEIIPTESYWQSAWSTISIIPSKSSHTDLIKDYILTKITDNPAAREPKFYYNTWGMQREASSENLGMREHFNEQRILEEIGYAADLNVEIFVFDDGWQEMFGEWKPNKRRLPNGIGTLVDAVKREGMIPGVWLSLMGVDSTSQRYKQNPQWVMRALDGKPFAAQWNQPAFDIVSDYYNQLLDDHKWLIDQGFRFFKWDAINTFNSYQPNLHHGDDTYSKKELIDRYNYLMPFYVTRLMREIRQYCPDVMIEIDLTETERALVGLITLQEGKLFWMNNGASGYGDYTTLRTKSMRNIINQTNPILPPEIFTFACYPHNTAPYYAQRYNVNTSLIGGHGFWGNLKLMSNGDRKRAGKLIAKAKQIRPHILGQPMYVNGFVGASPEIYTQIDPDRAYGLVVGFSGSAVAHKQSCNLNTQNLLGVLNHAYKTTDKGVEFNFQFTMPDDSREAFIVGNNATGVSILSSTGWIDDIVMQQQALAITSGTQTVIELRLPSKAKDITVDKAIIEKISNEVITLQIMPVTKATIRWQ